MKTLRTFTTSLLFLCVVGQELRIGGLFEENSENARLSFQLATEIINENKNNRYKAYPLWGYVQHFNTLSTSHTVCSMLEEGLVGIIGPTSSFAAPYIKSICDAKDVPLIEIHWDPGQRKNDFLVNIHPAPSELSRSFVDLIRIWEWGSFTIIYENDDSLIKIGNLLEIYNNYTQYTVSLRQLNLNGDHRRLFMEMKQSGDKHYVIDCSINNLSDVLQQAQQVGIMTDEYYFFITSLDMSTIDLTPYQYSGATITGIRIINPEDSRVIEISQRLQQLRSNNGLKPEAFNHLAAWKLHTQSALIIDAVYLLYETLIELRITKLDTKPLFCNTTESWGKGSSTINYMKAKTLFGLTGNIKFDIETGIRKNFQLDIVELTPGGLIKIGTWNSMYGVESAQIRGREIFGFTVDNPMKNKMFKVLTTMTEPYGMLKNVSATLTGNDRYEGFGIDVINELSKKLEFKYKIILQEDGLYGTQNPRTKQWNGMLGEVRAGRVDFAITDLTITSERESAVDFTMPFMNLGISILYRKPEPAPPSLFTFAYPFSAEVWILMAAAYILVSFTFFIMGRLCPSEWTNPYPCVDDPDFLINQFSFRNSLWFTVGSLMQQGSEIAPIAISTRMAAGVWYFFILIMVSSYTANLAAFLTVEELVTPFEGVEDLALQKEIKYGAKSIGATRNFFKDSNYSIYPVIKKYMNNHPDLMMANNDDGVRKAELENYAFFMESTSIDYAIERHCNLTQVGGALDEKGYGIAMKKDSEYRHILSTAILELQESGKLAQLKTKWWKEKRGGGKCEKRQPVATPLDLQNLGGVFFVLGTGTFFGVICTFIELAIYAYKTAKEKKIPFKQKMIEELKFFFRFKTMTKDFKIMK
ncbi:hypothetical protein RN001_006412 [Aquatica leii]|uniref:Glutamate receptor ionotropic, kainate 2 n=1 Tax=Aquatica leii TaxID=1421715 RepID=A0AAN7SQ76_9COLE|nr:hypothetical protein RN001_006412 [Aquatica leii]